MVALGILKAYNAGLALALFVTGILADNTHQIVAANDLAGFAKTFNGSSDFHWKNGQPRVAQEGVVCWLGMEAV